MENIIYPSEEIVNDPGQPWDGSTFTNLSVSQVEALDCPSIMSAVDRTGYVTHPVSCDFVNLPTQTGGTVFFMNPDTLQYSGSVHVQTYYPPYLQEDVIFDVFVSLIVANWFLDFVLFFAFLRRKVKKIAKS